MAADRSENHDSSLALEFGTYLKHGHARDTWVGILDDEDRIPETQLQDYIRFSNPQLFQRLYCLPFTSSSIPCSYEAIGFLRRAQERQDTEVQRRHDHLADGATADALVGQQESDSSNASFGDEGDYLSLAACNNIKTKLKRYIQDKLQDGFILCLTKQDQIDTNAACCFPLCIQGGLIEPGAYHFTLQSGCSITSTNLSSTTAPLLTLCISCLEELFTNTDNAHLRTSSDRLQPMSAMLDGVPHAQIILAADRLCPDSYINKAEVRLSSRKLVPLMQQPLNSSSTTNQRRQKQEEIENIISDIARFERAKAAARDMSHSELPMLLANPTFYIDKRSERYKRQGYEIADFNQQHRGDEAQALLRQSFMVDNDRALANCILQRICYCREIDQGDSDVLKCANTWCALGWFHVHCILSHQRPRDGEVFVCDYCCTTSQPQPEEGQENADQPTVVMESDTLTERASSETLVDDTTASFEDEDEYYESEAENSSENKCNESPTLSSTRSWGTPINSPVFNVDHIATSISEPTSPLSSHRKRQR